ncbi:MAG TPA: hypothetical protein RMH99_24760 [Sandaracinaceae bacterium LLY-WYZ-13_1]|nr:hypothetical protein [Sandaracinaceae bacterium LLY-WYZ-13_1]
MPEPLRPLRVHEDEPDYAIASLGGLLIQVYRRRAPLAAARRARQVADEIIAAGLQPRGLLVVTLEGAVPPDADARDVLTKLGTGMRAAQGCAFVSLSRGFGAAMMRSIMTGMTLLARPDFPVKTFADWEPGVDWIAARLDVDPEPVMEALAQLGVDRSTTPAG